MNKLFFASIVLLFSNCKVQDIQDCPKDEWLLKLTDNKDKAVAFIFKDGQRQLIEFHHCYQCPDAVISYYDCEGNKVCDQGGFIGSNNCSEFDTSEKIKIYPNSN